MITLELIRSYLPDRTVGYIKLGDNVIKTLERPWLNNEPNKSCIPESEYTVKRDKVGRFQYYRVRDVDGRTDIEFHGGVLPSHSSGCILVGLVRDARQNLQMSDVALDMMLKYIGDNDFKLIVRQYDPKKDGVMP